MSEWTALAAKVFDHRYEMTAWKWSAMPEDTYRANAIMEARLAMILYPGKQAAYEARQGWFGENPNVGMPLNSGRQDPRILGGIIFRAIPSSMGADNLDITDNDKYADKQGWFRQDWDLSLLVRGGMHWQYQQYLTTARGIWFKILTELKWIPNDIAVKVDRAIGIGFLPRMLNTSIYQQQFGPLPQWLQSPYRQAAWNELVPLLGALNRDVSLANVASLEAQAKQLEASRQFWDAVAKYSGADLVAGEWQKFRNKIAQFNKDTQIARDSITRSRSLLATNPGLGDPAVLQALEDEINNNVAGLRSQLPSSMLNALQDDGGGIGIAPVIVIAIGVAVIAAAAVTATTWVVMAEETARRAMEYEQELAMAAEDAANTAYANEQEFILAQEADLQAKLDAGAISPTEYDQKMAELRQRASANDINLTRRRAQTKDIMDAHHKNLAQLKPKGFGEALTEMKGILMWSVLGVVAIMAGPTIIRSIRR